MEGGLGDSYAELVDGTFSTGGEKQRREGATAAGTARCGRHGRRAPGAGGAGGPH